MPERAAAQAGAAPPGRPGGRQRSRWPAGARRRSDDADYSSTPLTFPSARRFSMIFWAMCGGTGS